MQLAMGQEYKEKKYFQSTYHPLRIVCRFTLALDASNELHILLTYG